MEMKIIDDAVQALVVRAVREGDATDVQKLSQAALNIAHAAQVMPRA